MTVPPWLAKSPRPSIEDLEASAGMSRSGTFRRLRTFLRGRPDVVEDLHHAGKDVGWGVRYRQGTKDLCSLVLWPEDLFAVVALDAAIAGRALASPEISETTKEAVRAAPTVRESRVLRLRLEDRTLVADFRALVLWKGGGPPPRRRP